MSDDAQQKPGLTPEQADLILKRNLANIVAKAKKGKTLTVAEQKLVQKMASDGRKVVDSINQAAALTGKPVRVLKSMKKAGCPAFMTGSRVDVTRLLQEWDVWANRVASRDADDPQSENWALRNEKLRVEIAALKKDLVPREEVARRLGALCAEVYSTLTKKLTVEWPATCQGMNAADMRAEGDSVLGDICNRFRAFAEEWK